MRKRSERDTLSGSSMENAIRIYIYIYLLRTPPRCSVEINVFELGCYFTLLDGVIGSPQKRTSLLGF